MPVSFSPYKPSTGPFNRAATSTGWVGVVAVALPTSRPYQATPAFTDGLCALYIQVMRPPQQNPVMPSLLVSAPSALAQATAASRSVITCASGTLLMTSAISLAISP